MRLVSDSAETGEAADTLASRSAVVAPEAGSIGLIGFNGGPQCLSNDRLVGASVAETEARLHAEVEALRSKLADPEH